MEKEKKKGKKFRLWWVTLLIVAQLGVFFGFGYAAGANKIFSIFEKEVKEEKLESNNEANSNTVEETEEVEKETKYKTCDGIYTGEGVIQQSIDGSKIKGEIKLTLNSDGTYILEKPSLNYIESQGDYIIKGNTLIIIEGKHTVGPTELDPAYAASGYFVVRGDCESIYIPSNNDLFFQEEVTLTK